MIISTAVQPFSKEIAVEFLADKMRRLKAFNLGSLAQDATSPDDILWKKALNHLSNNDPETLSPIKTALNSRIGEKRISPALSQKLFLSNITSITELEAFASCPFKHFISHGMRPVEVKDYEFKVDSLGIFYHKAIEAYINLAKKDPDFPNFTVSKATQVFNEAVKPIRNDLLDGPLGDDCLQRMKLSDYMQVVRSSAVNLTLWMKETAYRPVACEAAFGKQDSALPPLILHTKSGRDVSLCGKIDRYDSFVGADGTEYFRVVDYKTSPHTLLADAVQEGYQLQLPLYLQEIRTATGAVPAGAYYQQIFSPVIDCDTESDAEIHDKVMDAVRVTGLTLDKEEITNAVGGSVKASRSSSALAFVDEKKMNEILTNSVEKAVDHIDQMDNGVIDICPVKVVSSPCEYCQYKSVCRIDSRVPGGYLRDMQGNPVIE